MCSPKIYFTKDDEDMKRFLALLLAILCVLTLAACARSAEEDTTESSNTNEETTDKIDHYDQNTPCFSGKVLEIYEDRRCLVEVTDGGNQQVPIGEKYVVNTSVDGCPEYAVGDTIKVIFDGKVALSYPGQILSVYKIEKIK